MQARIVSGRGGVLWFLDGWRIFRKAMLGWLAMVAAYLLITNLVVYVPVVGIFAALVLVPPLSAGLMAGARAASRGATPELSLLFDPLRQETRAQLMLGAVYMVSSVLVFFAMGLADDSGQLRAMLGGKLKPEELQPGEILRPLIVAAVLYTPVMMAFWFAPPLAAWHSTGAAKALFFSFYACLVNWRAFLAYGAVTIAILVVLPFFVLALLVLLSGGAVQRSVTGLLLALVIVLLPTLLASFYASYRDVFGEGS
ncbi:MAG TPA: BPSS1780 family membrane protein [Burkholderiales bacterium]|nr:BPSS1780 family membrane protein [Burkholderiales bacterium]